MIDLEYFETATAPERILLLKQDGDATPIYSIISRLVSRSISDLKKSLKITVHPVRSRILFQSDDSELQIKMVSLMYNRNVQFESVTEDEIRVDLTNFLLNIK